MKLITKTLTVFLLSLICVAVDAQQRVTGSVADRQGEPLPGVSISLDGKAVTITDANGNFSLENVKPTSTISAYFLGFKRQTVTVGNQTNLKFVLEEDAEQLDDVVVIGYGTVKKNDLTGSVSSVTPNEIIQRGTPEVLGAIQGSVPGVNITQNSSRAGGGFDIDIRGRSSINGSTTPLYIVDGVECSDINWLNQHDIERIDILKDASSTAIYGSRATAGVVLVTTKGGGGLSKSVAKPTISYDGYYGVSTPARMPDFQTADEFYTYRFREFLSPVGGTGNTSQPIYTMNSSFGQMALQYEAGKNEFAMKDMLASNRTFDWPDFITNNGSQQNHYISVSGASEKVSYHMGIGYNRNKGLYEGDDERKFNFKGSLDAQISKVVSAGFTVNLAKIDNEYGSDTGVQEAFRMNPFIFPYDDETGELLAQPGAHKYLGTSATGYQFTSSYNPLLYWENEEKAGEEWTLLGNFYINLKPIDGLNFKTSFSPIYSASREGFYRGTLVGDAENQATLSTASGLSYTWDNTLTWDYSINDRHELNVMGLASLMSGKTETEYIESAGVREGTLWYALNTGLINQTGSSNTYTENSMVSFALRANYTLFYCYMLTATVRWDASSKFAKNYRWGAFPSVAFAWRISDEPWMKRTSHWLSNLKLRLSYGVTGNNRGAGDYATQVTIATTEYYPLGGTYISGTSPSGIVNSRLQWEKSHEVNVGLDFGFFNGRIHGSIDWYDKRSKDLLYDVDLPLLTGGQSMTTNVGSVKNTGVEIGLTTVNVSTKDWRWETTFSFTHNKNKVLEINGLGTNLVPTGMTGGLFIGYPVENVYAYVWDGIVTDQMMTVPNTQAAKNFGFVPGQQVRSCDYYYTIYGWQEGMPIIKDLNGDGAIDGTNDRKIYKSSPDFVGSFTSNLSYKNWDLSLSVYAKIGYTVSSAFYGQYYDLTDRGRMRLNADWYVPAGTLLNCDGINDDGTFINPVYQETTHYGDYPFTTNSLTYQEEWLGNANTIVDASYVKIKHISLGYTFPKEWVSKFKCQNLRLYATVTNPFVFTSYKGFDPEWAGGDLKNDGPSTITYQFGASITF